MRVCEKERDVVVVVVVVVVCDVNVPENLKFVAN